MQGVCCGKLPATREHTRITLCEGCLFQERAVCIYEIASAGSPLFLLVSYYVQRQISLTDSRGFPLMGD